MEYATSYTFKDGVNKNGYNRKVGAGGNKYLAISYLTNGTGAILESDMPFENNENTIELSQIQNKKVQTQVNNTINFPSYKPSDDKTRIKQQMKEHIKNYGGIDAQIYGAHLSDTSCYNNKTGAIYCDESTKYIPNHEVTIIGWDDSYSKENFVENKKPQNDGAWIIKNSWGTEQRITIENMKKVIFTSSNEACLKNGWTSAEMIPDNVVIEIYKKLGYTIENNEGVLNIGDNGFMYISYEDVNVYSNLTGITDAQTEITYDNIYQLDPYGGIGSLSFNVPKVYLGTVFSKKTTGTEYLSQISVNATEKYTCKVYLNPNGTSKAPNDLQQVQLKSGETDTFDAGYHTIEFLKPIQITGKDFAVVLEIQGAQSDGVSISIDFNYGEFFPSSSKSDFAHAWDNLTLENDKCFIAGENEFNNNKWSDTSKANQITNGKRPNFYTTIKAFTEPEEKAKVLESIEITTKPSKTSYFVDDDFDKTGMVVKAKYNDGTSEEITNYTIKNGTSLKEGQTSVTIEYEGKTVNQEINVSKKEVIITITGINVKTMPTKIQYIQNKEKLDLTGGVIEVTYSNGSKEEIAMTSDDITVSGFDNKTIGKNTITITYKEKTVKFDVEIKEEEKQEEVKKPENSNFDGIQGNVKNIKAYYFTDVSKKEYSVVTIDISNITIANGNDNMEYYYYLSLNPKETNIQNWVKIEKIKKENNKLTFEINTLDISNYEEIANANDIYLYVKEIATLNNLKQETIASSIKLEAQNVNVEEYVDGKKKADVDSGKIVEPTKDNTKQEEAKKDNTLAPEAIPKAGKGMLIIGLIVVLTIIGRVTYLKYKDIQTK